MKTSNVGFFEALRDKRRARESVRASFMIRRDMIQAERRFEDAKVEATRRAQDWEMQRQLATALRDAS